MNLEDRRLSAAFQTTLKSAIPFRGVGLHCGEPVSMTMKPAASGTGIVFERIDLLNGGRLFPARHDRVVDTFLGTTLSSGSGARLATIEHVMAALAGCGVDNALIEVDGPELPIMDGSAEDFVFGILRAGTVALDAPREILRVLRDVEVTDKGRRASLRPSARRSVACEIVYDNPRISRQRARIDLDDGGFRREIAGARTFGLLEDVDVLRAKGLALGGSLENAVVFSGMEILNEGGLRFSNECARHKVLDAIGDLALAGAPVVGAFEGYRSGHELNVRLLAALFEDDRAWRRESAGTGPEEPRV